MAEAYPYEYRDRAEEMYIEQGMTYEQVAEALKVGLNTVKGWGKKYDWKTRRKEHLDRARTLRENLRKLRYDMVLKAIQNLDPQDVYAVARLIKLMQDLDGKKADGVQKEIRKTLDAAEIKKLREQIL
ncbi:MAG: hypothetical protein ABIJ57_05485 [Pseudomonadota bacterium]